MMGYCDIDLQIELSHCQKVLAKVLCFVLIYYNFGAANMEVLNSYNKLDPGVVWYVIISD